MSVSKFKIGDKVRVIDDIKVLEKLYGDIYFTEDMEQYRFKTLTISGVDEDFLGLKFYRIKEDNQKWFWDDDMLELAVPSFKIGDKVECINDDCCSLIKKGTIYTVRLISPKLDAIMLKEVPNYYYGIEKFELADEYKEKTTNCLDVILEKLGLELEEVFEIEININDWKKYKLTKGGFCHVNKIGDFDCPIVLLGLLTGALKYRKIKPIPTPQPTEEEQKVLDAAKVLGFNWVAKDKDGKIEFYENKPVKCKDGCKGYWDFLSYGEYGESLESKIDFKFLSWEDEEPYEIK